MASLARRLGTVDFTLITMGSVIGSGIFRAPSVVAQSVHHPQVMLFVWIAGGAVALTGAFIFAELAARRPIDGGFYAHLRDAFGPQLAFMLGWMSLFVWLSGGMAASAVLFAGYFQPLTGIYVDPALTAVVALGALTIVNCLGVRQGGNTQNALMILKLAAIAGLIVLGFLAPAASSTSAGYDRVSRATGGLQGVGIALIPVLFTFAGWNVATYLSAEVKDPSKTIPRGILWGMVCTIVAYLFVNIVCIRALGTSGLMHAQAPASDVLRLAMGPIGGRGVALLIALSTLGFLSNRMLTAPRLYHAMAQDGLFFKGVAWVHPGTRAPVVAIVLQGIIAAVIARYFSYEHILSFMTWVVYFFYGMGGIALFIFRKRDALRSDVTVRFHVPGHPVSTILFIAISFAVTIITFVADPYDSLIGVVIAAVAFPVYALWSRWSPFRPAPAV